MKSAYGYCCYYWWWWWFALLGLLTALIVPQADSLHLTNKNVALYYGDNAVTSLASFRYSHNGQFKYQATSMHLADSNDEQNQNTTYQESVTLVITTEEIWLSFIQSIKTLHVDVCPDWPQHLKSTTYISFANLTKPHLPEYVLPIQSMGEYLVLIINCSNKKINLEFNLEMLNMGPNGKWTQFTYGLFQLPWVYLGFAGGVWPAICIIWWSLRYKNRKNDTLLNRLLMIIPHCRLIFATLLCLEAFYYSRHGEESYILLPFQAIFRFCSGMLIYTTNMLVSKGWCVTRRHMLKLELRTVLGTAFFAAVADVFYAIVHEGAVLALGTMQAIMFMYLWLNFRHQQVVLAAHLYRLRAEHSPHEVLHAYARKALLLFYAQRVIVTFGLIAIAINFFANYLIGGSSVAYVSYLAPELTAAISIAWLGWLFRLRKIVPIDLSHIDPDEDEDNDNEWNNFNPFMPGGMHPAAMPVTPTAPSHAFNDTPVVAGIGAAGARRRIMDRLFRREDVTPRTM